MSGLEDFKDKAKHKAEELTGEAKQAGDKVKDAAKDAFKR